MAIPQMAMAHTMKSTRFVSGPGANPGATCSCREDLQRRLGTKGAGKALISCNDLRDSAPPRPDSLENQNPGRPDGPSKSMEPPMSSPKISVKNLYKVFGSNPSQAIRLLDEGRSKDE